MEISENAWKYLKIHRFLCFLYENGSQIYEHCANNIKIDDRSIDIVLFHDMEMEHRSIIIVLAASSWIHGSINGRTDDGWTDRRADGRTDGRKIFKKIIVCPRDKREKKIRKN